MSSIRFAMPYDVLDCVPALATLCARIAGDVYCLVQVVTHPQATALRLPNDGFGSLWLYRTFLWPHILGCALVDFSSPAELNPCPFGCFNVCIGNILLDKCFEALLRRPSNVHFRLTVGVDIPLGIDSGS